MSGPIALKLLVIDDNRQNLDLITTALEQEGVEILTLRLASTYFCASDYGLFSSIW